METVLRGAAVYLLFLVILRLSGRRTLSQMTPFDLVLLLIVAEATQQALLGVDYSIVNSIVLLITLVTIDVALSYVKRSSLLAEKWLDGRPTLLVVRGVPDRDALRKARLRPEDVMESARMLHGLERLEQVKYAVLESSGDISIIPAER